MATALSSPPARASSGVGWIDRHMDTLEAACRFLENAGYAPQRVGASTVSGATGPGMPATLPLWHLRFARGAFTADELIDFAHEAGFRHG